MDITTLMHATGLSRTRLFEYARLLRVSNALLWHCAGSVFECSFVNDSDPDSGESRNPGKRDLPSKDPPPSKIPQKTESRKERIESAKSRKAGIPESGISAKAEMRQITDEYIRLLEYKPDNWAEGEGKAAKQIGQHFTVEEFREAYQYFKAQKFWHDKRLTLRHLKTHIDDYFIARRNGRIGNAPAASSSPMNAEDVRREFELMNPGKELPSAPLAKGKQ